MPLALAALGRLIDTFFTWISQQVQPLIAKFGEWANALVAWIVPATVKFLGEWPGMLNSFLNWIGGAVGPILAKLLEWAGAFIGWVIPAIPGIIAAAAGIAAALLVWIGQTVGVLAGKLLEWGAAFIGWIGPKIPGILAAVGEVALSILSWIGETAPKFVSKLVEWGLAFINWIGPKIPGILAAVGEISTSIVGWIGQQVTAFAGKLVEWGTAFVSWVGAEVLPKLPGALAEILTKIGDWVGGAITWVGGELAKVGKAVVDGIKDGISKAWSAFTGWIGDQVAKIPEPIRAALGIGSPSRVMADLVGIPIVQGIAMGVESGMGGLLTTMGKVGVDITASAKGAITGVAGAFKDNKLPEAAASAGRDIIAGWMGGMKGKIEAVKGVAAEVGQAVVGSLKGTFEIGSPSKLMSREIGIPIVDGITAGINIASPKLSERMLQLGTMLVDLVSKGVDAFGKLRSLGTISMSSITQFADTLQSAMSTFGEMTLRWDKAMMSAASQFTRKSGDVVDLISKGVDMLSKMRDFEAIPAGVFRSFSTAIEQAILEIVRISTFANRQLLTNAQSFSEGAGKVIAIIGVGVDALNKLGTLAQPVAGSFLNFSIQVSALVHRMGQAGQAMAVDTVAAAAQFSEGAGKVLGVLGSGVDGLMKLQDLGAPIAGSFLNFSVQVHALVHRMSQVAGSISESAVKAAAQFSEGAGKVISIIGVGVEAFKKLKDFEVIPQTAIASFALVLSDVIYQIVNVSQFFAAEAVATAGIFADGAGKMLAIIGTGVDGFAKLKEFESVTSDSLAAFALTLSDVVYQIVNVSQFFVMEAVTAAGLFSESVGKMVGVIGAAVEGFSKLEGFVAPGWDFVANFGQALRQIVDVFVSIAAFFTASSLEAAALFADSAGKVVGIVGAGVEGFSKLEGFIQPGWDFVANFGQVLKQIIDMFVLLATQFAEPSLTAAAQFADAAGKVVGIISGGVEGFTQLADLGPVSDVAIANFTTAINQTMLKLGAAASQFSADAIAHAGKFADAAGSAVGILKDGVEGLLAVDTFAGASEAAIGRFADGVRLAVAAMARLAAEFGPEATAAAMQFAKAAGESTDFFKKGVDGFVKLEKVTVIPQESMDIFSSAVVLLVNTIIQLSNIITTDVLAQAVRFATGMDQVIDVMQGALKAITDLGDQSTRIPLFLATFTASVANLARDFANQVVPPATNIGLNIAVGIANGISMGTPAIQNAIYAAVAAAIAAAKAALGIASPSKVFASQIGHEMGAGTAQGVINSIPLVTSAVGAMSGQAVGAGSVNNSRSVVVNLAPNSIVVQGGGDMEAITDAVANKIALRVQAVLA